jgi:hypothetical protein
VRGDTWRCVACPYIHIVSELTCSLLAIREGLDGRNPCRVLVHEGTGRNYGGITTVMEIE